jgi:hypothetical protein
MYVTTLLSINPDVSDLEGHRNLTHHQALVDCTDKYIYNSMVHNKEDTFLVERVQLMLSQYSSEGLYAQSACLGFLGSKFRVALDLPERCVCLVLK